MNARVGEVVPAQIEPLPAPNTATSLLQLIERAASNPQADIDKMERLMAMHERVTAREAETAFNDAMTACQTEIRRVAPDADNPQTRSRYATYAKLDRVIRPVYTRLGFSISYDTDTSPEPEHIRVLAYVSKGGHTRTYKVDMPKDGKGAKGGDVMTKTHATGAGMQYGMRYLLKGIFNVAIGDEDNDGNDTRMTQDALEEWVRKIEAATTKPAAKEIWSAAVKEAKGLRDLAAAQRLKEVLIAHAEFIDQAEK